MNNSLKNLEIKFMQKNVIVVEGNVYDLMIKKTDQSISIYTIFDKISEISKNNGYRFLVTYNPSRGRTWLLGSDTNPNEAVNNKEDNFLDVYDDENKNEKITDFLNYVAFDIEQSIKLRNMDPKIYVIDFADFYFDNATSGEVIESMIKIISALLERKYVRMQEAASLNNLSKVIFITREANNLTRFLSTKNDEYASVMITKPNIEERKEIFISSSVFDTEDAKELRNLDSKKQLEAVALTDGFTCKEILQLGRLNINAKTFKELYMVAQFNKKDSE